jgi:hypothetical protein
MISVVSALGDLTTNYLGGKKMAGFFYYLQSFYIHLLVKRFTNRYFYFIYFFIGFGWAFEDGKELRFVGTIRI